MSFQAYLDAVKAKTGKTPEQLRTLADKAGIFGPDMKATALITWLAEEFGLGRGHSMAVWTVFKEKGWVAPPRAARRPGGR